MGPFDTGLDVAFQWHAKGAIQGLSVGTTARTCETKELISGKVGQHVESSKPPTCEETKHEEDAVTRGAVVRFYGDKVTRAKNTHFSFCASGKKLSPGKKRKWRSTALVHQKVQKTQNRMTEDHTQTFKSGVN